jgi:hypothetical protein
MENVDKKQDECACGDSCRCGCGGGMGHMHCCHGGRGHLVRLILKILIVVLIFWCGFRLGEITGSLQASYRYENSFGMMNGYNNQ